METTDFFFELKKDLIAQYPCERRGTSRLFCLDRRTGKSSHVLVADFVEQLADGTLLVFNDSRVRKARLIGQSASGRAVEVLLLEELPGQRWRVMTKRASRQRPGKIVFFPNAVQAEIEADDGDFRILRFNCLIDDVYLDQFGHVPLPPYIKRPDAAIDVERYQTVYSKKPGSTAAPTAGLHFTNQILDSLQRKGFQLVFITLDVGPGTFLPVRTKLVEDHVMHEEKYTIGQEAAVAINQAKKQQRPILAVGTTTVRSLESAWQGELKAGSGATRLFIYPGYQFKVIDQLFTNFHVPQSSLFMLVSAFAGRKIIMKAYQEAIDLNYRFFSYGDAMLIT